MRTLMNLALTAALTFAFTGAFTQTTITADAGSNKSHCGGGPWVGNLGGSPTASCTGCGATSPTYSWSPGGYTVANPSVSVSSTTTYTVTVSYGSFGSVSDQVLVTINCLCCRLSNPADESEISSDNISIYPNPSGGLVTAELKNMEGKVAIYIYDAKGDVVASNESFDASKGRAEFDLGALSKGMYFMRVANSESVLAFKKIILQ